MTSGSIARARYLRRTMTAAERRLWYFLRRGNFMGLHFRKQVPIGHYIADFVCFEKRLVIELDGGQHADKISYDHKRTEFLRSKGFLVLRYWNNEVLRNCEGVLEDIMTTLNPHPVPPPHGEGKPTEKLRYAFPPHEGEGQGGGDLFERGGDLSERGGDQFLDRSKPVSPDLTKDNQ